MTYNIAMQQALFRRQLRRSLLLKRGRAYGSYIFENVFAITPFSRVYEGVGSNGSIAFWLTSAERTSRNYYQAGMYSNKGRMIVGIRAYNLGFYRPRESKTDHTLYHFSPLTVSGDYP